jgi:hypothetical protein
LGPTRVGTQQDDEDEEAEAKEEEKLRMGVAW